MSAFPCSWPVPCTTPTLGECEVHVWGARLDQAEVQVRQLMRNLCEVERSRAEKFLLERDRRRFVVRRGILRDILSGYLAQPTDRLQFRYGYYGKPHLVAGGAGEYHFNLSHSDEVALFAFACGRHVGIDVERVRLDIRCDEIAAQFFTQREYRLLRRLGKTERLRAFLDAWTCKEAYVKARGEGLSFPVERVEVSLSPRALRSVGDDEGEASHWTLREVPVGDDYGATVAAEGDDWRLRCWQWQ